MPILCHKLKLHDSLVLFIVTSLEAASAMIKPFTSTVWQFYLANAIGAIAYSKYAVVRSLLSKCIDAQEMGKMFSLIALVSALVPIGGNPLFRQLYNFTLSSFPGAFFILFALLHCIAAGFSITVYFKRKHIPTTDSVEPPIEVTKL